jgi:hypothetical protein
MAQGEGSAKPGFRNGFPMGDVPDGGMVLGQADEDVILVRWQAGSRRRENPEYQKSLARGDAPVTIAVFLSGIHNRSFEPSYPRHTCAAGAPSERPHPVRRVRNRSREETTNPRTNAAISSAAVSNAK